MYALRHHCLFSSIWKRTCCGILYSSFSPSHDNKLLCCESLRGRHSCWSNFHSYMDFDATLLVWRTDPTNSLLRLGSFCWQLLDFASGGHQLRALLCCGISNSSSKHDCKSILRLSCSCVGHSSRCLWLLSGVEKRESGSQHAVFVYCIFCHSLARYSLHLRANLARC